MSGVGTGVFEARVLWNDPGIGIVWPPMGPGEPILKEKDRNAPRLAEIVDMLRAAAD